MKSYLPGTWYAVFSNDVTVVLPPSEKARVAAVWAQVDDGAGFDAVLDALLAAGLSSLSAFALIGESGDSVRALCRGNVRATFGTASGQVLVDGTGAATWQEGSADSVHDITIEMDAEATDDAELCIGSGLVRVSRVSSASSQDAAAGSSAEPGHIAAGQVDIEQASDHDLDVPLVDAIPDAPAPVAPVAPVTPIAVQAPQFGLEDAPSPFAPPVAVPDAALPSEPALVPEPPMPQEWAAPSEPEALAEVAAPFDPLEESTPYSPIEEATIAPEDIPADIPAPADAPAFGYAVARLHLSTGETVEVDRPILLGRAPEARRYQVGDEPRIVVVPSPNQEISSTHLEIRPGTGADHGSAVVTDLGSTNGTVVVQPGLGPEELQAGVAVALIPGAIVDLGDNLTIQVTSP